MQGTCAFGTGCRGARLLAWLILNARVQPSFIAGVYARNQLDGRQRSICTVPMEYVGRLLVTLREASLLGTRCLVHTVCLAIKQCLCPPPPCAAAGGVGTARLSERQAIQVPHALSASHTTTAKTKITVGELGLL